MRDVGLVDFFVDVFCPMSLEYDVPDSFDYSSRCKFTPMMCKDCWIEFIEYLNKANKED